ncbi:MAG TPA: N-6 DNA methylase, partial [Armatimonadota bacterium]|nr:N-6 DNA methylase [Armatimonadota bacterium]
MMMPTQLLLFEHAAATPPGAPAIEPPRSERELLAVAMALGASGINGWSEPEDALTRDLPSPHTDLVKRLEASIRAGSDPLGELFCSLRSAPERRLQGATYTPNGIVNAMIDWAMAQATPDRVVDPGAGSARFLVAAAQRFPRAALLGVELDPVAAILARANLATLGLGDRATVTVADYRTVDIKPIPGRTLYIGNPPYIRHHLLPSTCKQWLVREAGSRGLAASQLAGLHVYFFLATVMKARAQDFGAFITAAEWLDVN